LGILLGKAARRLFWTLASIGFVLIVLAGHCALASDCLSRREVRSANPASHLSYSGRVGGHKGARCWYADERRNSRVRSAYTDAPESQGKHGISDVSRDDAGQPLTGALPRAVAQSRPPRFRSPSARLPGRTVGSIPATGATAYASREVALPLGLEQWINKTLGSEPIASFSYRFDAAYGQ